MSVLVVRCICCDKFLGRVKLAPGSVVHILCRERRCKCLTCVELTSSALTITRADKGASLLSSAPVASN